MLDYLDIWGLVSVLRKSNARTLNTIYSNHIKDYLHIYMQTNE